MDGDMAPLADYATLCRETETLLIVDDEENQRRTLSIGLRLEGFDVVVAGSSPEALQVLASSSPPVDLALIDLMMPGMSGFEVLSHVREREEWKETPVIVLTGIELNRGDTELLRNTTVAILKKGQSWKQSLLGALRKTV